MGAVVAFGDYIAGLPPWVVEEYDAAEKQFGDGICKLITDISRDVNTVVKACEGIISKARQEITTIYTQDLPASLNSWAADQQQQFGAKLDKLQGDVTATRTDFNRKLVDQAAGAVQEAAAGAIAQAIEAIYRVLKWIFNNAARIFRLVEAVVNGMADVIAGNVKGVATMVENALAMLIAPVIDFIADYIGLGGLPAKVADAVFFTARLGLSATRLGVFRTRLGVLAMSPGRFAMRPASRESSSGIAVCFTARIFPVRSASACKSRGSAQGHSRCSNRS